MDYGRYFKLDMDASDIGRGIAVFRYRPDGETDSPVYMNVTDHDVEFHVVSAKTNNKELYIPLEGNLDRNIDETLADAFTRAILIPDMPPSAKALAAEADQRGYFAPFFRFGKRVGGAPHPWTRWKRWTADKDDLFPLAKLVLDFLFDLRETRVFQMSPDYWRMHNRLYANFCFHALDAKASYLYQRQLHAAASRTLRGRGRKQRQDARHFYGELLFKAEKEWTGCIRDPRSDKAFADTKGWFDDSEREMIRVYRPRAAAARLNQALAKEKRENDKRVSQWLLARYSGLTAWGIFLSGQWSFFGIHLFWPRLAFAIGTAWLTSYYVGDAVHSARPHVGYSIAALFRLLLLMIFIASVITIQRVAPLAKGVLWRALKLTCLAVLIALIVGKLFAGGIERGKLTPDDINFLWIWSAFTGLVVNLFMKGLNPSEST